ncbi:O-methyltransferase [Paracoccus marcusii]|uniref:O-methyltransferase n=1 Tax=Paracoccus marcusii TaxID=59779 RepID=UPI001FCA9E82|nr:O-methyltransferase [Paracoccus marcusii]
MASFDSINYSIRPSKSVQRGIVFEGLRRIANKIDLDNAVYIGFGSIWFTDFVQAHKILHIDDMVSIEANDIGFRRATFNKEYRTISVMEGRASARLPDVLAIDGYNARPWVVWLDYDCALNEEIVEDMQWVLANAPPSSVVLFTFSANATQTAYGKPRNRPDRVRALLGDVVPDELSKDACEKETLPTTLAGLVSDFLKSEAADAARPGGFIDAFRLPYLDSVAMVTVGGILPAREDTASVRAMVADASWGGIVDEIIEAPPMTLREIATLQAELPAVAELTRARIQELGFDLHERQIRSFQNYYKYLPSFAEIVA